MKISDFNKIIESLVCKPSKESSEIQDKLEKEFGIECNIITNDFILWRRAELDKINKLN